MYIICILYIFYIGFKKLPTHTANIKNICPIFLRKIVRECVWKANYTQQKQWTQIRIVACWTHNTFFKKISKILQSLLHISIKPIIFATVLQSFAFSRNIIITKTVYTMLDLTINHHSKFSKYSLSQSCTKHSSSSAMRAYYSHAMNALSSQHTFNSLTFTATPIYGGG